MNLLHWLNEYAGPAIRVNIAQMSGQDSIQEREAQLLTVPEVQYWLGQLDQRQKTGTAHGNIHGSHDYRYENILGKLVQLGLRAGMSSLDQRMAFYRERLAAQVEKPRPGALSFHTVYSYYDHELIVAAFLALAGYTDPAVQAVARRRVQKLLDFAWPEEGFYYDGVLPGVRPEWQGRVIQPRFYADGQIGFPVVHDYYLLSAFPTVWMDEAARQAARAAVDWMFTPAYASLPPHIGYFWIPGGSYAAKAVCWKLPLPDVSRLRSHPEEGGPLLQTALLLAGLPGFMQAGWLQEVVAHLDSFRTASETYLFPSSYLIERKDGYWVFGAHMGMAENRRRKTALEVESTYWMVKLTEKSGL